MAKPSTDLPGSGLHLHCSLENAAGENLFTLEEDRAPAALRYFIGGLQTYLPEVFALLAPNINSYKRFAGDLSMPINLEWGYDNRTTGLRVPYGPAEEGRVETRVIGADANPYLMIAAILAAGLLGIESEVKPTAASEEDCWEKTTNLPDNLDQALTNLDGSEKMAEMMGREFLDVFASIKRNELQDYNNRISSWEVSYLGSML